MAQINITVCQTMPVTTVEWPGLVRSCRNVQYSLICLNLNLNNKEKFTHCTEIMSTIDSSQRKFNKQANSQQMVITSTTNLDHIQASNTWIISKPATQGSYPITSALIHLISYPPKDLFNLLFCIVKGLKLLLLALEFPMS